MSKILKNTTGSDVVMADVGQSVPASGQLTISPSDYDKYAQSNSVVTFIGNGTLIVNDGSSDLSISDGVDLIKGLFPKKTEAYFSDTLVDSFGRLRISTPLTVFDQSFLVSDFPLTMDSSVASGGAVSILPNLASARLSTTTTNGSSVILQTRRWFNYQPGKSFLTIFTGNIGAAKANVRKRLGFFNANNGLFFEQTGSGISVVRRSFVTGSAVDVAVAQSSWNLDKLDGTGASGVTLNFSLQQIFIIDFQWLGSGRVRFGFCVGGRIIYCHEMIHANVLTGVYMSSAVLPLRYEIANTATAASSTDMDITCMSVQSEGGYDPNGTVHYASNGTTVKVIGGSGTFVPVLSLRKSSAYVGFPLQFIEAGVFMNSVDDSEYRLIINPTLTGASWASNGGISETDVAASALSGGTPVGGGYIRGASSASSLAFNDKIFQSLTLILGSSIAGVSDIFCIAVRNITIASTALAYAIYKEQI